MSRFWAAGSGSESDSSSDDSSASSSVSSVQKNRWVMSDSDDSSEEAVRVAKSAKQRTIENTQAKIKAIRNALRIRDYITLQNEFEGLTKYLKTNLKNIGHQWPKGYIAILCQVQDGVKAQLGDKPSFKKLSPTNGRALNRMKQVCRRTCVDHETMVAEYRDDPEGYVDVPDEEESDDSSESDDDSDSDSDDESNSASSSSSSSSSASSKSSASSGSSSSNSSEASSASGDDESEDWASSSESSSSSSDSEASQGNQLKGRARWLKKTVVTVVKERKDKTTRAKERADARAEAEVSKVAEAETEARKAESFTPQTLLAAFAALQSQRGRRGTQRYAYMYQLANLAIISVTNEMPAGVTLRVVMGYIQAMLDTSVKVDEYMNVNIWKRCVRCLLWVLNQLDSNDLKFVTPPEVDATLATAIASAATGTATGDGITAGDDNNASTNKKDEDVDIDIDNVDYSEVPCNPILLRTYITNLHQDFTKHLQQLNNDPTAYTIRLADMYALLHLVQQGQNYFEGTGVNYEDAAEFAVLSLESLHGVHDEVWSVYYADSCVLARGDESLQGGDWLCSDDVAKEAGENGVIIRLKGSSSDSATDEEGKVEASAAGSKEGGEQVKQQQPDANAIDVNVNAEDVPTKKITCSAILLPSDGVTYRNTISDLTTLIYQHSGNGRSKTRSVLCHVINLAIHGKYAQAKDLLLLSHLQDNITGTDVATQILYNRTLTHLAIAAFTNNNIYESHQLLSDVMQGRTRELLAQGVSYTSYRNHDRNIEQERAEKRRLVVSHAHIPHDLLEAVHFTCAMLLEVPNIAGSSNSAASATNGRGRYSHNKIISRQFRKYNDIYTRVLLLHNPPETVRDRIMLASQYLMDGDWQNCADVLCNMSVWKLLPGGSTDAELLQKVKDMLLYNIKVEALRTYLLRHATVTNTAGASNNNNNASTSSSAASKNNSKVANVNSYDSISLEQLQLLFTDAIPVHSIVSKMILNYELHASWDSVAQCVVFHNKNASTSCNGFMGRSSASEGALAIHFVDKLHVLVESNEKLLDVMNGGGDNRHTGHGHGHGHHDNGGKKHHGHDGGGKKHHGHDNGGKHSGGKKHHGHDNGGKKHKPHWRR